MDASPTVVEDDSNSLDSTTRPEDEEERFDESLLSKLQPRPFQCYVSNLTIAAPVPPWTIPMAIPITVPRWIQQRIQRNDDKAVPKEIVRGVNLEVKAGEVLAIIGGSGSGKTTLLNAIADRAGNLELTDGSISYSPLSFEPTRSDRAPKPSPNGAGPTSFKAKKVIGYVRQDDYLLPFLTVRETLAFSAALRLPRSVPAETRDRIIDQTMTELGLADAKDTIVGGAGRKGISGGERRRLSIGCVLVTLPSVLVLDEPTSGLDSFTAHNLLLTLSNLAKRGRCVVLSIHQPRSDAYPIFDKITLLSQGSVIFSGLRTDLLRHFATLGYVPPKRTNPLDFVIDVSSIDNRDDEIEVESKERVGKLVIAWKEFERQNGQKAIWTTNSSSSSSSPGPTPPLEKTGREDVEKGVERRLKRSAGDSNFEGKDSKRANVLQQTLLLTRRNLINASRNYGMNVGLFLQAVIIGVGIGLCFLNLPETPSGIQSLKTVVYFFAPGFFYLSIVIAVFNLCQELVIFDRERDDNLYGTTPWVIALILGNLPANVVFPTLYAVILYFMCGLSKEHLAKNVFSWIACAIMLQQSSWSYALLAASINRSFAQASLLANGFSILFVLSSGYIITNLGVWISWTRWLSPYFYAFNWQVRLQFLGRQFACPGVTGAARNQCDGQNVLVGLRLNLNTPIYVFPLGLLGFIIVTYLWATVNLTFFHPGRVSLSSQTPKMEESHEADPDKAQEKVVKREAANGIDSRKAPVNVVVNDLELIVQKRSLAKRGEKVEKVILENVNAYFPAGELSVIMGPSGAGKSSLLQMLAGRLSSGAMSDFASTGTIKLNGREFDSSLASLVAFVEQEDSHHLPALTVRETLRFAARLRLKSSTVEQCNARAEEVLRMLGLKACADNMVGGELVPGARISGGEKRRLSLGVQLLSDPPVLLADEPLSGLDAFTAQNVMQTLKDLAASGRTLIVSVHQPRSDIWQMFDNVLLLVKGGRTAYSGPTKDLLETFEQAGEVCPANFNPADFILDVVSVDYRTKEAEETSARRVSKILACWQERQQESPIPGQSLSSGTDKTAKLRNTAFARAFPVVLRRSFKNLRRQQDVFIARVANPPFMALLFWLFFGRLGYGPSTAQDRIGLLQETTALPFVGMLSCIAIFPFERDLYFHEHKSSARHSVLTFLLAYTVQETVVSIISSFLFSVIFVYGMNMQDSGRIFVEFWFSSYALISFGESIGIMFCAFCENGGLAVSLVSAGITLLAQLNGVISANLMFWLKVIGWIAPMKPQAWLVAINEFSGLRFRCDQASIASGACIAVNGEQVLDVFDIPHHGSGKFLGILIALVVLWRIFAWIALRIRVAYL
ncbi:uncharacterized protein JCM15063_004431 [Sporobolomyces koalae]|uniref:uncharacterized protein n=1 Tax=Sporobolomyces koalae TaxID=500713 RepID=UPI00317F68A4